MVGEFSLLQYCFYVGSTRIAKTAHRPILGLSLPKSTHYPQFNDEMMRHIYLVLNSLEWNVRHLIIFLGGVQDHGGAGTHKIQ